MESFNAWLKDLPHKHKIVIAGNHDRLFEINPSLGRKILTNATYLQDQSIDIDGVSFYGSPWTPTFYNWSFMADRGERIRRHWERIPTFTDVLITHGPPKYILDEVKFEAVGCMDLNNEVQERIKPKVHIFGHIHEGAGKEVIDQTTYLNASMLDENYQYSNKAQVIDV